MAEIHYLYSTIVVIIGFTIICIICKCSFLVYILDLHDNEDYIIRIVIILNVDHKCIASSIVMDEQF